jgi:co-chaperonin GroES (HSP10)
MNLKPLGDRLVVKPTEQEEVTSSGIFLPETAKEKPQQGKVIAAGPGARKDTGERIAMDVNVGDTVLLCALWRHQCQARWRRVLDSQGNRRPGDCREVTRKSTTQRQIELHNLVRLN